MSIPIPYIDAGGTSRTIAAEQLGSNIAFDSVPNTNGAPVATGNPMPVADAAAEASLATIAAQDTLSATAAGTPADAAYAGSGSTSIIGGLKGLYAKFGAVVLGAGSNVIGAVTQSGSWVLSAGSALIGKVLSLPSNVSFTTTNVTATTGSTPVLSANAATVFMDIQNTGTVNVTLYNGANLLRILLPYATFTREGAAIPTNAITAIAASGTVVLAVSVA